MDPIQTAMELIQQDRRTHHIQFRNHLSNHLSMTALSLASLGATEQRLRLFYQSYSKRLEPAEPLSDLKIDKTNWKQYLGQHKYYREYRQFFENESKKTTHWKNLVTIYVPELLEGLIGSAFHPLILLGYGIEFNLEDVVLDGLAYMCFAYTSLGTISYPDLTVISNVPSPIEILKKISSQHPKRPEYENGNFQDRVNLFLNKEQKLLETYDLLEVGIHNWYTVHRKIFNLVLGLYSTTRDFFILHCVTSCHALRKVLNIIADEDKVIALRYFMRALIVTYIIQKQPPLETIDVDQFESALRTLTWADILPKAISYDDEHTIKIVFALWKESKELASDKKTQQLCLICAAQQVGTLKITPNSSWNTAVAFSVLITVSIIAFTVWKYKIK